MKSKGNVTGKNLYANPVGGKISTIAGLSLSSPNNSAISNLLTDALCKILLVLSN